MRTLRHFTILTRLVLAWFVLSPGVAVAPPTADTPADPLRRPGPCPIAPR